jgi:NADP-dependent 3-hydroxy acid dehydrogenase YdfG
LWVVTRGATAAGPQDTVSSPLQSMTWGLGRVAGLEHPDRWGGLVDLPPGWEERTGARLAAMLAGSTGEDQVAIRATGMWARRLVRAPLPAEAAPRWQSRGTALITGGTGAIGRHVARWLTGLGTGRVLLTSRSGPAAPGVAGLAAALAGAGADVAVLACDVAERSQAAALLAWTAAGGPPLTVIVHAAGTLDDGVLDRLDPARLGTVLAAKAAGAAHLDQLTAGLDLDAFVLFSSAAAVLGSAGQGNYAAANAFLDALAQRRRDRGLPATGGVGTVGRRRPGAGERGGAAAAAPRADAGHGAAAGAQRTGRSAGLRRRRAGHHERGLG